MEKNLLQYVEHKQGLEKIFFLSPFVLGKDILRAISVIVYVNKL